MKNIDKQVVKDFGEEWSTYNQADISDEDLKNAWLQYFQIFPFSDLDKDSIGFDMGCGSGRWAKFTAQKVGHLNCIDPSSKALDVAKKNLVNFSNISYFNASVSDDVLESNSQDFGYCLGVLHHIPDTLDGINCCAKFLKKGAPFLMYLYYDFENRSFFFKLLWKISDYFRILISRLPTKIKRYVTLSIAITVYFPIARTSLLFEKIGLNPRWLPLSDYRSKSFSFMATDSLDRFGTRLEKRFNKVQIERMLNDAGFERVLFSNTEPFWVCLSYKS